MRPAAVSTSSRPISGLEVMLMITPCAPADAGLRRLRSPPWRRFSALPAPWRPAHAHRSVACVLHDGAHVGKVQVDEGRHIDQCGRWTHALTQQYVRCLESVHQGDLLLADHLQPLIGITIRVVHMHQQVCNALPARPILRLPSKAKGLVTIPTVRMPRSWATSATTPELCPVPVPPPIPAGDEYHLRAL